MDELRSFYNKPTNSRVVRLRGPQTSGIGVTREDATESMNRREGHRRTVLLSGTDYSREAKERELQLCLNMRNEGMGKAWDSVSGGLDSLEQLSSFGMSLQNVTEADEAMNDVYAKYNFETKKENGLELAINDYKEQILNGVRTQQVVIIEGPTGCGKTTQVPQWILDDSYNRRKHCKIIVTQPRRIAAISIAKRVAQERGWDLGGLVGYQVGLENQTTTDSKIMYVTTGILLQKLVAAKTMNEYTHIILDEVHERGQEMDFLLLVVKRLLYTVSPRVKVILMSATFNVLSFSNYFKIIPAAQGLHPALCIKVVKSKPLFSVKTFYLNDLLKFNSVALSSKAKDGEPGITSDMYQTVLDLLVAFESIDLQEDNYAELADADIPSVLVFLPGINEIEELFNKLSDRKSYKWWVLPLHSTITPDEQVRVFQRAPRGYRKVILSTNIAESSITVPDIKYVIDFCLMKVMVADEETNFTSLQLMWASKANCDQRAGRAGRVRDGRVYRLVNEQFYNQFLPECKPEICRCPLERLVLLAKMLDIGPPSEVLALAMDPPDLSNIQRTILVLKEVGGLMKTVNGELSILDGDLTYLGRLMAKLPLDVRVSKLIMLGHIFGCLEDTIIMAAAMTVKNVFSSPFRERHNAYNSKLTWADGSTSDCIAFLNVYKVWHHLRKQQYFKQAGQREHEWGRAFYVQVRAIRELEDMVRELHQRLSREGIEPLKAPSPWSPADEPMLLKLVLAGAFYPHYFVQSAEDENREREAFKTLGGLDPRTTVYLKNFPHDQPGEVYASSIKQIIANMIGDEPKVTFDKNSAKVFLSFDDTSFGSQQQQKGSNSKNPSIPGKVVLPVYKAIKAKQLRTDITIKLLPPQKARELADALEMARLNINKDMMVPRLPEIDDTHFPLKISHFINCGHFFVVYDDESTASSLHSVQKSLNAQPLLASTRSAVVGEMFAAPYKDDSGVQMCRVRVRRILPKGALWVFYVDYGNCGRVNSGNLRELPDGVCRELPPLAMECVLAEVAPSVLLDAHGQWSQAALSIFMKLTQEGRLLGKVYSLVHGVVAIELLANGGQVSVNKTLVNRGVAQYSEESYESKLNHDLRETASDLNNAQKRAYNKQQTELAFEELSEAMPPSDRDCVTEVQLKGPYSPLESTLYNLMYSSREKQATIEWNSVNSVLLDTEPQDVYARLLVAGTVGTNESGGKLTLRHTTLMPNIPGLPAIMSLLFCPMSELRRSSIGDRYVSALCGLGCDDGGAPLFPEHDILVNIDATLSVEDVALINHIRFLMDYMIYCPEGQDRPTADDELRPTVPRVIRDDLMPLLQKRRRHHEPESIPNAWEWNSVQEDELLEIESNMVQNTVIYPLHVPSELRPISRERLMQLKRDNDLLVNAVMKTPGVSKDVQCKLCGTEIMSTQAMRIHLYSRSHRDKEEDFKIFAS